MALKDLVSSRSEVHEDDIEAIINDYVRYDADVRDLILTSNASQLSNKAKILVVLVANEGWIYIDDDYSVSGIPPKKLEEIIGIAGGTLRPILGNLKKQRLVSSSNEGYRIVSPNLSGIKEQVS